MRKAMFKEWYGDSCEAVENYIAHFNKIIDENVDKNKAEEIFSLKPKALIVPHAGWVYSGFTANFAYRIATDKAQKIAVIGPSHKFAFDGISITLEDEYETPCGNLKIDTSLAKELIEKFDVQNLEYVHTEHSTEVQMPFIKHYFKNPQVIELIYSNYSPFKLKEIINYLLSKNVVIIISSDLSHYYDLETAKALDANCLEAVINEETEFLKNCEACGKIGIEAIILSAKEKQLTPFIVDYRTSAEINKDTKQVVGYMSAIFI
ncbi:MAG: AmmeMemoRadiSam system protein B [Nautiliaceae bacterium]